MKRYVGVGRNPTLFSYGALVCYEGASSENQKIIFELRNPHIKGTKFNRI